MTKYEFLSDLSRLLSDLPEEERNEAMLYYDDYFADAGRENEAAVIQELESPEKIAAKIKGENAETLEYGENSSARKDADYPGLNNRNAQEQEKQQHNSSTDHAGQNPFHSSPCNAQQERKEPWTSQPLKILLIIVLIIALIPVILPAAATLFGIGVAFISVLFALFCALFASGIGLTIGGLACIFSGLFLCATTEFASGILGIGIGLILFPLGIILGYLAIILFSKLIPAFVKACGKVLNSLCNATRHAFS